MIYMSVQLYFVDSIINLLDDQQGNDKSQPAAKSKLWHSLL